MEIIIIGIVILIAGAVFIFCLTKLGGHSDSGAPEEKTEKRSSGEKKAQRYTGQGTAHQLGSRTQG